MPKVLIREMCFVENKIKTLFLEQSEKQVKQYSIKKMNAKGIIDKRNVFCRK